MSNEKQKHNERELSSALQSEELTMNTSATCTGTSDSATTSTATTDVSTTRSTSSGLPVVGEKSVLAELKQFDTQVQGKYDQQYRYDQQYEQQQEQDKEKEQLTEVEALSRDILRAEKQEAKTLVEDGDMCATYRDPVAETALWQGEIQPLPRPSPRATTSSSNTCTGGAQAARASVPGAFAVVSFRPTPTSATFDDLDYENETSRDATTTDPDQGATAHNTPTIADLPSSSSSERQPQICPLAATLSPDETATAAVTVACTRSVVGTSYTAGSSRELSLGDDPSSSYTNYDPEDPSRSSMVAANTSITPAPLVEAKVMHGDQDTNARPKDWFFIALMMAIILVLLVVAVTMALALAGLFQPGCSPDCDDEVTPFTSWTGPPHNESVASGQAQAYSDAGDTSTVLSSSSATASTTSLLEKIRQDGVLECLYLTMPGLYHRDDQTGEVSGFNSEWCKAVAAAIMGPKDYKIEYIDFNPYSGNFGQLNPLGSTFTMTRHVREARSKTASYFSAPIFYDGLQVAGDPFFVECVQDKNFQYVNECADLRACTMSSSAHGVFTLSRLPKRRTVQSDSVESVIQGFVNGSCNVMFGESASVAESTVRGYGYQGNYTIGDVMFTKVPNSLQSRGTDRRFGDFMNAVVQALFVAEQHNITKSTAHLFPQTSVFGDEYKDMFRNALAAVGNYGEIYHEHLDGFLPRTNINQINFVNDNNNKEEGEESRTGLLYSYPIGRSQPTTEDHELGANLRRVLERGHLICGVRTKSRPGFAAVGNMDASSLSSSSSSYSGLDVDFCRAVAAGLFGGDGTAVEFVDLSSGSEGYEKLSNLEVDVMAGGTWNLENDVQEASTGLGFAFSQPYFYGYSEEEDNLCLVTREDDQDWLTFVFWTVAATIHAEEHDITQELYSDMPTIYVYGASLDRMFQDVIFSVGNYGEIYNRSLQELIPRGGRNRLNSGMHPGPQHYPMPGLI